MAETVERIPQHTHCGTCGNAHVNDGKFCSEECKAKKKTDLKKKKRQLLIIEIAAVVMMIIAVAVALTS